MLFVCLFSYGGSARAGEAGGEGERVIETFKVSYLVSDFGFTTGTLSW